MSCTAACPRPLQTNHTDDTWQNLHEQLPSGSCQPDASSPESEVSGAPQKKKILPPSSQWQELPKDLVWVFL